MKNKIILLAGDPNSVNSELIYKVWKKIKPSIKRQIYLISNFNLFDKQLKKLKIKIPLTKIKDINKKNSTNKLKIVNVPLNFKKPFNIPVNVARKYLNKSFNLAHILAQNKKVKGLINCPLDKRLLHKSKIIGVTELLSSKCKLKKGSEVMFIHNDKLSVVPLTTHINIKNVSRAINYKLIISKMRTLRKSFKSLFKFNPKIGVLGLNPHNSEFVKNSEETKIILPAIKKLKKEGLKIYGPFSSDTFFVEKYKKYNVVVGMYHDQVLIPFKSLFKFDAINITLGLRYIRVSPDHGPAKDLISKNKANSLSLLRCINFVNKLN